MYICVCVFLHVGENIDVYGCGVYMWRPEDDVECLSQ